MQAVEKAGFNTTELPLRGRIVNGQSWGRLLSIPFRLFCAACETSGWPLALIRCENGDPHGRFRHGRKLG